MKVEEGMEVTVNSLKGEAGDNVEFDKVLLIDNKGKVKVGTPTIKGAKVKATILEQKRGETIIVFKKKRRKGYQKANGHRQYLTTLQIDKIQSRAAAKPKKTAEPKAEDKKEEKAEEAK